MMLSQWEEFSGAARWNPEHGWHDPVIGAIHDGDWLLRDEEEHDH